MIAESLSGKRIAITGATGFLGTALVERLLRSVPDCEVVCIVRPTRKFSPIERIKREVIRNDCFDRLRSELGAEFDATIERRLSAIAGDVSSDGLGLDDEGRQALSTCDVVIHSAATVSFDSPLDLAVEVNLLGPVRVAEAIRDSGANAHLIAVSTAYVAGNRRGEAHEELVTDSWYSPDVDWRKEVASGRRALADAEYESRQLEKLAEFGAEARNELGPAGIPLIAEKTEKLRADWVKKRLVDQGKARAQSLGFPDVYPYTKALGERALIETRGDVQVTFVRPSIIESALVEPHPGWIRGFRMAEPIIIGVGKGLLKSFPGLPEGVLDVIPVDKVVATIIAVAAQGPQPEPSVYQIASGTRKPLRYRAMVELITEWYRDHPLYDADGQPIVVDPWDDYPTADKVKSQLKWSVFGLNVAEKALQRLPLRGRGAELIGRIEEQRTNAERALGYLEIYAAYTASEARYRIDRTMALYNNLDDADRQTFNIDPIDIDWKHYLHDIHLPSIIASGRVRSTPVKKTKIDRVAKARENLLKPERQLVIFDLENTLTRSTVADTYTWLALRHLNPVERAALVAKRLPKLPTLLALSRRDRGDFLREFYRWYAGQPVEQLREDGIDCFNELIMANAFDDAFERLQQHREAGHRTMLITGALDLVVEPLRPYFDEIVCARLAERDGVFSGDLETTPPVGEARALLLRDYAADNKIDLGESIAYADSASDLPMLEIVGFPVAVNPETRLAVIARRRGWHLEHWSTEHHNPFAPLMPFTSRAKPRA